MSGAEDRERCFQFVRNGHADSIVWGVEDGTVRKAISEAMSAKNVAFLLGAGCSSFLKDGQEVGIPTMAPLAQEFCAPTLAALSQGHYAPELQAAGESEHDEPSHLPASVQGEYRVRGPDGASVPLGFEDSRPEDCSPGGAAWRLTTDEFECLESLGIDLEEGYNRNLERLMEVLFSLRFVLQKNNRASQWPKLDIVNGIIEKALSFLWSRITNGRFAHGDHSVIDLYEQFYKKLVLRDRSLPRPWVFTTNYDVFNETAMDRLGIPYTNGFNGIIERRFNPATFRYALAEQIDVSNRKWTTVDAFVYLCKLHGSVSWTEDEHGLFPIREIWPPKKSSRMLIFPTPAKQNASLASPYSDLFREFQSRIVREQSVLFTAGYAFGDEHINKIIYQALTIPTFRLVVFADPDAQGEIEKLSALQDPRIWIIGGDGPTATSRAHYFNTIVEHFMPERPAGRIDDAVRRVLHDLAPAQREDDT